MGCKISHPKESKTRTSNGSFLLFQRIFVKESEDSHPVLLSFTKISNDLNFTLLDPSPCCSNLCSSFSDISLPNESSSSTSVATAFSPIFFHGPVNPQYFAFPDSIMYYLAKNPSTAKLYQKMIQSCKYFFTLNPVIVVSCMNFTKNGWRTCLINKDGFANLDVDNIPAKLWFCDKLHTEKKAGMFVFNNDPEMKADEAAVKDYPMDLYISKFYRYELDGGAHFSYNTITLDQLLFFAKAETLRLEGTNIIHENGSVVQIETIVANFPRLKKIDFSVNTNSSNISINTVKELLTISHFMQMKTFILRNVCDAFDVEAIYKHLKERDNFHCALVFRSTISNEYFSRLEVIVDELLATTEPTFFQFPYLKIPNLNNDKQNELFKRYDRDCARRVS